MKIVVGSKSPAKLRAAQIAVDEIFQDVDVETVEVDSGVDKQPKSDEESINGAINRAKAAQKVTGADYAIGMEGGIQKVGDKWFECGWIAVIDQDGEIGLGSSARFELSNHIADELISGKEMREVFEEKTGRDDVYTGEGAMGIITDGHLPRDLAYSHGVIFAFAKFISDPKFWD